MSTVVAGLSEQSVDLADTALNLVTELEKNGTGFNIIIFENSFIKR
jgi:hypothetical protein